MSAIEHVEWTVQGHGVDLFAQGWLPEGKPRDVIAIAHGYAEHGGRYGNLVERLVPLGYALYALDHRGHGRSGGSRALIDRMDTAIEDFHRFVREVRARHGGRRIKLVGHSMGGIIAFGYALRWPADLTGLVLSGPALGATAPLPTRLAGRVLSLVAPEAGTIELPPGAISRDPEVVAAYRADPLVTVGKIPARTGHEMISTAASLRARAHEMKVPVLVQHGEDDKLATLRSTSETYERIGADDRTVITYPGLYHEIYNEPERATVIDDLIAWLETHPG